MLLEAALVFAGALLLFLVEPLAARMLLPLFGGSAAVWLTALLFFQAALLGGYAFAHALGRRRWPQLALLALACLSLPVSVSPGLLPHAPPAARLLAMLALAVGLPFFALATTGPTVQALQARRGVEPWWLYALSNGASALGLLLYPLALEPLFTLRAQTLIFSTGFAAFALAFAAVVLRAPLNITDVIISEQPLQMSPLVLLLPACSSALLLAVTASITQNLAPVPLLWLLPLALYLASFVIAFQSSRRWVVLPLLALFALALLEDRVVPTERLKVAIAIALAAFFLCCLALHAELARLRPDKSQLTRYYLWISAGSVAGSLFVAVAAPLVFDSMVEMKIAIVASAVLLGLAWMRTPMRRVFRLLLVPVPALLCAVLAYRAGARGGQGVWRGRNFYGAIAVRDEDRDEDGFVRIMVNGAINHGAQSWQGKPPEPQPDATTYYVEESGVGRALAMLAEEKPRLTIGIVGLGAGVLATYCRPGDAYVFYEINPLAERVAREQFTFLRGCPNAQVREGDARLSLESEPARGFDLLVIDAFTSDSIPVHLLTREAFATYARHLAPDGILAVHVSNRYLDLTPVVAAHADRMRWPAVGVEIDGEDDPLATASAWILLSPRHPLAPLHGTLLNAGPRASWTDDYSNLITLLR